MDSNLIKKILKLEKEINIRYNSNKLNFYNKKGKVHTKQIEFHKCKKRNRWVFGGNRSGKTECGAVEVVYLACGVHPYQSVKTGAKRCCTTQNFGVFACFLHRKNCYGQWWARQCRKRNY